ncbi:MAG: hypothetical protein ACRDON_02525 [Gaiellaceae bacterium]
MEEEREKVKAGKDEPDVEAHRTKAYAEGSEAPDPDADRKRKASDSDPDVEAHRFKS